MKIIIKWSLICITILIFLYAFSSSYSAQNIDNLDYVIALGIDYSDSEEALLVSFEFIDFSSFSGESSSGSSASIINTVQAPSIESAINIMNGYIGKQINLSHCKVIVFSDKLAQKGILKETSFLMNNIQVRPTANVIISKGQASDYLENSTSSLEKELTKYFDIFPNLSKYTGYSSNILLGKLYENMLNNSVGTTAILGSMSQNFKQEESSSKSTSESSSNSSSEKKQSNSKDSSSSSKSSSSSQSPQNTFKNDVHSEGTIIKGDRGTENFGLAVLKNGCYVGKLSAEEALCHSLLKSEVNTFVIRINSPFSENEKIELSLNSQSSKKTKINTSNDTPDINIECDLFGKILSLGSTGDFSNSETLKKINDSANSELTKLLLGYLNKTSKEFKTDIDNFANIAKKNFKTIPDFSKYNWAQKYENANFNVKINTNITSSILISNT